MSVTVGLIAVTVPFVVRVLGLAALGGAAAFAVAALHRWYAHQRVPLGFAVLVGLGAVALTLNTDAMLTQTIEGGTGFVAPRTVASNVVVLVAATASAAVAADVGDRSVVRLGRLAGEGLEDGFGTVVRTVGRTIEVEVPERIRAIDGYDPVDTEVVAALAGATLQFPRGLTVAELERRLVDRLESDYGVGAVDVDVDADGTVQYLAVGSRAAGLGPTLAPGTEAVPVRADPAYTNGAGDRVQLWRDGPVEHVATGELRAARDDVATVAVDRDDAAELDAVERYRLVTMPVEDRPDRAFASVLRAADETVSTVTVEAGSALVGSTVGALDVTVLAVEHGGAVATLPPDDRAIDAGDALHCIAAPQALRSLERAAGDRDGAADGEHAGGADG